MNTIADAVKTEDMRQDKLFGAAKTVQSAACLPQETRDALIKHISDARAKHPRVKPEPAACAQPDSRPGPVRAAVGKAVDRVVVAKRAGK